MAFRCPRCGAESHHPEDERWQWCSDCQVFAYEYPDNLTNVGMVIGNIQRLYRYKLNHGFPCAVQLEQFPTPTGFMAWRALVRFGDRVDVHTVLEHRSPHQALIDLDQLVLAAGLIAKNRKR